MDNMESLQKDFLESYKNIPLPAAIASEFENILLTEEGTCRIIDFDSAREYKPGEAHDTFYMGTEKTAAPEQFGFMQTDERTDISTSSRVQ